MSFNVNFHYGGKFVKDNAIYYLGRHEHIVDIDPDKWSFFEATGIVKDLSHLSIRNISYGGITMIQTSTIEWLVIVMLMRYINMLLK